MAANHGTRRRYTEGCHCNDCTAANTAYQQRYRQRGAGGATPGTNVPPDLSNQDRGTDLPADPGPGPVESGVAAEIDGLAAQARPGLAAAALCLARLMDNPRAINQQPAAAKVLVSMLEKLRSASPAGRRGLAVVREMTKKGG
jgi:hypothetical protein